MSGIALAPPVSPAEPVTDVLHGVPVIDPYRWLEDQESPRTRQWIEEQTQYARSYLDRIPGREKIRERIREFLAVESYDSVQKAGNRFFFRKRLADQEQPCIYMREGADGEDQLLIDPAQFGKGKYVAAKPVRISPDGHLLLYEIKEGGDRMGTFALLDVEKRTTLPDILPRGYLRGFAFAPDEKGFYYVHEAMDAKRPLYRAVRQHVLGTQFAEDAEVFCAGENDNVRLSLVSDRNQLGILVYRLAKTETRTDFFLRTFEADGSRQAFVAGIEGVLSPQLVVGKILAITDHKAPNLRIVELRSSGKETEWVEVVPETDARISQWQIAGDRIFVCYIRRGCPQVDVFDLSGRRIGELPVRSDETIRLLAGSRTDDELLFERESFAEPISTWRYSATTCEKSLWAKKTIPFDREKYAHARFVYHSKDGTSIPITLVGRPEVLAGGCHPAIMTSYGGFGVSMTPQFSVFVAFLLEHGCLFALPNIRGGSEFGAVWHDAAKRRKRQTAYDDFICAAEWLMDTGRTTPDKLAIFGGSNSGLLVGAALTQRPDLFQAVVCMVPMLDMLRYHLFDNAQFWRNEYGTAEDAEDFAALVKYSPYHRVRKGVRYPATMIVSGDLDRNCNPLHARKMTARLQGANTSENPAFLDYGRLRGHSPVLPLSERIEALTDRMAFLCDQLRLPV